MNQMFAQLVDCSEQSGPHSAYQCFIQFNSRDDTLLPCRRDAVQSVRRSARPGGFLDSQGVGEYDALNDDELLSQVIPPRETPFFFCARHLVWRKKKAWWNGPSSRTNW